MTDSSVHRTIEAVWRMESAKIIAKLARMLHDVGLAEELAQDALVTALEQWPRSGTPDNPGAWRLATGKSRGLDALRHRKPVARNQEVIVNETLLLGPQPVGPDHAADDDI